MLLKQGLLCSTSPADVCWRRIELNDAGTNAGCAGIDAEAAGSVRLVSAGRWNPASRVACNRQLVVAGHRLACTHPPAPPFDAREALTWSCNSYFAAVARTLRPGELGQLLRPTGLLGLTGFARDEAAAEFQEPESIDAEQLALLGVEGVRVTPLELAAAYRWLVLELAAHPDSEATRVVRAGLEDSASFGMAGQASLGGVAVMGKTGTAEGSGIEPIARLVCGPCACREAQSCDCCVSDRGPGRGCGPRSRGASGPCAYGAAVNQQWIARSLVSLLAAAGVAWSGMQPAQQAAVNASVPPPGAHETLHVGMWTLWHDREVVLAPGQPNHKITLRTCSGCAALTFTEPANVRAEGDALTLTVAGRRAMRRASGSVGRRRSRRMVRL